jgi:hypothetical protein
MLCIGYQTKVPRKVDIKGWKTLEKKYITRTKTNPYYAECYEKYIKGKKQI